MDLESRLDNRLWKAVESPYQNRDYRTAILDSIHFVSQLIRDKAGLESDGQALAGEAFGGTNPKLRVNSLQTESDRNVQKGVEALLRGLYQAIRNPRSHGRYTDTNQDAEAVILFVDFLVRTIDQSKSPFEKDAYLQRICDDAYFPANNDRYAELLAAEIPNGKKLDVLIEVYNRRNATNASQLRLFCKAVMDTLSPDDVSQFCSIVSDNLKTTMDDTEIRTTLQMVPEEYWPTYAEAARIRIENKLIEAVKNGRFNRSINKCVSGGLGTWIADLIPNLSLSNELSLALTRKIASKDRFEEDYVFQYFFHHLSKLQPVPNLGLTDTVIDALKAGDKRFYNALDWPHSSALLPEAWEKAFGSALDDFQEASPASEGISDDDVPF